MQIMENFPFFALCCAATRPVWAGGKAEPLAHFAGSSEDGVGLNLGLPCLGIVSYSAATVLTASTDQMFLGVRV